MPAHSQITELAVLMTCHNRRASTLRCLRSLAAQQMPVGCALRVFLTDDGSTDGTGDAVRAEFPDVTVLAGDGNQYWGGGTRMAWRAARPAAFYLWINDDVELKPEAVRALMEVYDGAAEVSAIIVGATCDPKTGKTCTGGMIRKNWFNVRVIDPSDKPLPVDTCNGNIVLVPRAAEERIGMLDERYTHFFGDGDYGLRARKAGIPLVLAPRHLGECQLNSLSNTSFDSNLPFRARWKKMFGPKGYRPPREWWAFVCSHSPRPKVFFFVVPYVLFLVEALFGGKVRIRRHVKRPMEVSLEPVREAVR